MEPSDSSNGRTCREQRQSYIWTSPNPEWTGPVGRDFPRHQAGIGHQTASLLLLFFSLLNHLCLFSPSRSFEKYTILNLLLPASSCNPLTQLFTPSGIMSSQPLLQTAPGE